MNASQCDIHRAQSTASAASQCQSDCVKVLGELWGIWEAATKQELCQRRGRVINCSDYYREFLQSVYNSVGSRGFWGKRKWRGWTYPTLNLTYTSTLKFLNVKIMGQQCDNNEISLYFSIDSAFPALYGERRALNLSWPFQWRTSLSWHTVHTEE